MIEADDETEWMRYIKSADECNHREPRWIDGWMEEWMNEWGEMNKFQFSTFPPQMF